MSVSTTAFLGRFARVAIAAWMTLTLTHGDAAAESASERQQVDLNAMSLKELMAIDVTTAGKKHQTLSEVPAAAFVITSEDIRRGGFRNLPEALRLAPGVQVAQIDANQWAISIRGFNGPYSNKLLVLIDGRVVYTPTFGGVFWDAQDLVLEDVERIEVIRGPGGTLWGANAVNGVINVITKTAGRTLGSFAEAGSAGPNGGLASARYGGRIGTTADYRVYGRYLRDSYGAQRIAATREERTQTLGGFRMDWRANGRDTLSVQSGVSTSEAMVNARDVSLRAPFSITAPLSGQAHGGSLQAHWTRQYSERADLQLDTALERTIRSTSFLDERRTTATIGLQHHTQVHVRHDLVWGAAYETSADRADGGFRVSFTPASDSLHVGNAFAQDDITLVPRRLRVVAGTKLLHNTYSGWEQQPSARALWTPHEDHTLWFAVSRAVRLPTRAEEAIRLSVAAQPMPVAPGVSLVRVIGSRDAGAEHAVAYELGYRLQVIAPWFVDLAVYRNAYTDLDFLAPQGAPFLETAPAPAHIVQPISYSASGSAHVRGAEVFSRWQWMERWRVSAGYTWSRMDASPINALNANVTPGVNPSHHAIAQSAIDLPHHIEWDSSISYTSRLRATNVPAYTRVDARVSWRPVRSIELDLVGQNLLQANHVEWVQVGGGAFSENISIPRSVFARITWRR